MTIIITALGLILVFLILSLLATSVQEVVASWFSLREKNMEKAINRMLVNKENDGKQDDKLLDAFKNHNIYQQITPVKSWFHRIFGQPGFPAWIDKDSFVEIVRQSMDGKDLKGVEAWIADMEPGKLKTYLENLLAESEGDLNQFFGKIGNWFDRSMDHATDWYKSHVHTFLLCIGLGMACLFNADSFSVYAKMAQIQAGSPEESSLLALAQKYLTNTEPYNARVANFKAKLDSLGNVPDTLAVQSFLQQDSLLKNQINGLVTDLEGKESPLGLGWKDGEWSKFWKANIWVKLTKLLGILVTTLAISLGAPFWFNMLKRLMSIKSGNITEAATEET